jgi:outer membrane biosynthesis protein TonB
LSSIGLGGPGTKSGQSFGRGGNVALTSRASAGTPELVGGEASVEGNIDGELIRQVIRRNSSKIRACYEEQLIRYPQLGGRVSIRFVINSEGAVDTSKVHLSAMAPKNAEIGNCVANKIRLLEFPRPKGGGTAQVTYPFIFKPTG